MMRSLYSGVSGLQNHQTRMDVIGNNIANVNTTGFKRGRVNFQDMISQQLSGASKPTEEKGGVNPKEVGLGMTVASIDNIFTQNTTQEDFRNALVLHKILENRVVYRIANFCHNTLFFYETKIIRIFERGKYFEFF